MIHTDRLLLRPIELRDKEAVFAYRSDPEANKYQGWVPESPEEVEAFIKKNPSDFNEAESWFQLVLVDKENGAVIGDVGIHFTGDQNRQCELGVTLSKAKQGCGFAREAMHAVMKYLFTELNKHRIFASVDPANRSSIRLLERLGFRKEAHFRESLFFKGEWVDDVVYGLLAKEWVEKQEL
ncbi:MAG: GNAT family N-acetyltransferase [Bacteroidetes bacterium]|nr:GNAT family N-acetyltransferase [Bacteroidota bacterium]